MPNNGRLFEVDVLEYHLRGTASNSGSGAGVPTYGYSGSLSTSFVPNTVNVSAGLLLTIASTFDGTSGSWEVMYDGPGAPFGGYIVSGTGYQNTEIKAVIRNVKIYAKLTGALLRLVWGAVDIYVNGAFNISLPGSAVDMVSDGVGPQYIPLIGLPPVMTGGCSAGRINIPEFVYDPCDPSEFAPQDYTTTTTGTINGGFRFQSAGTWVTLPCLPYTTTPPAGADCPYGLNPMGIITGNTCDDITINCKSYSERVVTYEGRDFGTNTVTVLCLSDEGDPTQFTYEAPAQCIDLCTGLIGPAYRDLYRTINKSESRGGNVTIIPNLTHRVNRHATDYQFMWYRGSFPSVNAATSRVCEINGVSEVFSSSPTVYPFVDVFLGTVGDDYHPIESPLLDYPTYSPTNVGASKSETTSWTPHGVQFCICGDVNNACADCPSGCGVSCVVSYPTLQSPSKSESVGWSMLGSVSPDEGGYLWHIEDHVRFFATWCNRLWHFLHWREDWSDYAADEYWLPLRQQWLYNAALPAPERPQTRTDLIGSCSNESGHTPFLDTFVGGLRWIGCSRFQVRTPIIPTELATDETSAALWKFGEYDSETNTWSGTGSVDADGITIDAGETKITLTDTLSWTTKPFLYPLICDRLRLDSTWDNVDGFVVYAVGRDGSRVIIADSYGIQQIPRGSTTKYAGSWAIDNGLSVVTDQGIDSIPADGWSDESMSDPKRMAGFQLLPSNAYYRLEFELVPIDAALPMTIKHPVWLRAIPPPRLYWESGQVAVLIWPDGQMLRLGNWVWYVPGLGLQCPPLISGAGYKSTIIDALCTQRIIFEGKAHDDGLLTELSERYDHYEGQSVSVIDKFSVSYPLPWSGDNWQGKFALLNTMAEEPPLILFPNRLYNPETWELTNQYGCHVWDWSQHTRYLIHPGAEMHLFNPADAQVTTLVTTGVPDGWKITKHSVPVDNLEANDWKVKVGTTEYAEVQPWRGYSAVLGVATGIQGCHVTRLAETGILVATILTNEGVEIWRFDSGVLTERNVLVADEADFAQSAWHPNGYLVTAVADGTTITIYESFDWGKSATESDDMTGSNTALAICPQTGIEYLMTYDGGSWKCYRKLSAAAEWTLRGTIGTGDNAAGGLEVSADSANTLVAVYIQDSDVVRKVSLDGGATWTVV